jgi:hypothetical protein
MNEDGEVADLVAPREYDRWGIFDISEKWIWDTGCPNDLANYGVAIRFRSSRVAGETL